MKQNEAERRKWQNLFTAIQHLLIQHKENPQKIVTRVFCFPNRSKKQQKHERLKESKATPNRNHINVYPPFNVFSEKLLRKESKPDRFDGVG